MDDRGVREVAADCSRCDERSTTVCERCRQPLCADHAPASADHRCKVCENDFARRPPLWKVDTVALLVAAAIGGAVTFALFDAGIEDPILLVVMGPAAALMLVAMGQSHLVGRRREAARRRRFLKEQREHVGVPMTVFPISALESAKPWMFALAIASPLVMGGALMLCLEIENWWLMAIGPAVLAAGSVAIATIYFSPGNQRAIAFRGDEVQILDGSGAVLFSGPAAEYRPGLATFKTKSGSSRCKFHPVLRFEAEGTNSFTVYCDRIYSHDEPAGERSQRVLVPKLKIDEKAWKKLTKRLGVELAIE